MRFVNTDAIWGAFWNLTQLWALAYPQRYTSYVQTQLEIYKEQRMVWRWNCQQRICIRRGY